MSTRFKPLLPREHRALSSMRLTGRLRKAEEVTNREFPHEQAPRAWDAARGPDRACPVDRSKKREVLQIPRSACLTSS
jgi:hypothetical protein